VRDLPTGTVSFLFTDIEGSTRLLQELGDDWPLVVREHHRLMREAFAAAHGQEVDTQGDAFFAVFGRARDAIDAAVACQRALAAHEWPRGATVRARVGIHTGEPRLEEEGYLGLDVVRASRVCAAAHGGQIVITATARELVRGNEPEGVAVRDLGGHTLRDIAASREGERLEHEVVLRPEVVRRRRERDTCLVRHSAVRHRPGAAAPEQRQGGVEDRLTARGTSGALAGRRHRARRGPRRPAGECGSSWKSRAMMASDLIVVQMYQFQPRSCTSSADVSRRRECGRLRVRGRAGSATRQAQRRRRARARAPRRAPWRRS
jgi:class 3 adenylate cyclase